MYLCRLRGLHKVGRLKPRVACPRLWPGFEGSLDHAAFFPSYPLDFIRRILKSSGPPGVFGCSLFFSCFHLSTAVDGIAERG